MNRWIPASLAQRVPPHLLLLGTLRAAAAALAHLVWWASGLRRLRPRSSATLPPRRLAKPEPTARELYA